MQFIELPQPPTTNQTVNQNRTNRFAGSVSKKAWTNKIALSCSELTPYDCPVYVAIEATYPRANCDPDNLFGSTKAVFDGLVTASILKGDSAKWIKSPILYTFKKEKARVIRLWLFDNYVEFQRYSNKVIAVTQDQ